MKIFKKITVFLLALCMAGSVSVTAEAAEEPYAYTVRFFAGARGTFKGKQVMVFSGLKEGERVTFRQSDITIISEASARAGKITIR